MEYNMSIWSKIETDIEAGAKIVWDDVLGLIDYIFAEEAVTWKTEILPLIQQAAVNLQNESPGLNAKSFIPAVVASVLPILPQALLDIEQTAIFAITSFVAQKLGVSNNTGNQGVVTGPVTPAPSA